MRNKSGKNKEINFYLDTLSILRLGQRLEFVFVDYFCFFFEFSSSSIPSLLDRLSRPPAGSRVALMPTLDESIDFLFDHDSMSPYLQEIGTRSGTSMPTLLLTFHRHTPSEAQTRLLQTSKNLLAKQGWEVLVESRLQTVYEEE